MKILLQHMRTELFLCESGDWTRDPEEARDFEHSQHLIDHAHLMGLKGVQIVVKFHETGYDEVFPLPPAPSRAARPAAAAAT